jgi:YaiO family outer membrane protein
MGDDAAQGIRDGEKENMIKAAGRIVLAVCLAAAGAAASPQETMKDQALKALRAGRYAQVVRLCTDALRSAPEDEDLLFLLARARAYGDDYTGALQTLDLLVRKSPKNTDYLLLRARIESWRGNVAVAQAGFDEVLKMSPGNPEALSGLGSIAVRKGDMSVAERYYLGSLARDPRNPEVHFALGNVYLWQGAFAKARESYKIARELDPKNSEYKKALTRIPGRTDAGYEFRLLYQPETFTDGRESFQSGQAAFLWHLPRNGPAFVFKGERTRRFGLYDTQVGLEIYPRLWKGGSAYVDINASPGGAKLYPQVGYLLEIYQALSGSWDISAGFRRMEFEGNPVSIFIGSLGLYSGAFYTNARIYYSPKSRESKVSWLLLTRWYFQNRNYLYAGYGQGTRSMEIAATGDLDYRDVNTMMVGLNVTVFGRLHLVGSYNRLNDRVVGRNTFSIGAGYTWGRK